MNTTKFENLKVYKLSETLADILWDIVAEWEFLAKETVGIQLIRAGDSIGANIAEGVGRYNHSDNRRFVRIARGSLYEVKHWLRRAYKRNLLSKKQVEIIQPVVDELTKVLAGYLNSLTKKIDNQ